MPATLETFQRSYCRHLDQWQGRWLQWVLVTSVRWKLDPWMDHVTTIGEVTTIGGVKMKGPGNQTHKHSTKPTHFSMNWCLGIPDKGPSAAPTVPSDRNRKNRTIPFWKFIFSRYLGGKQINLKDPDKNLWKKSPCFNTKPQTLVPINKLPSNLRVFSPPATARTIKSTRTPVTKAVKHVTMPHILVAAGATSRGIEVNFQRWRKAHKLTGWVHFLRSLLN